MTIGDSNKIEAKIGHPRLFGAQFVNLNIINFEKDVENDISYLPIARNPDPSDFYEGPETRALDKLSISEEFTPTSYIRTQGDGGGYYALPDTMIVEDANTPDGVKNGNLARVGGSYTDPDTIDISTPGFDSWVHLGATKLYKEDVVVENATDTQKNPLTEGEEEDYIIDYHRGRIKLFSSAGSEEDTYEASYSFKNTSRNIAYGLSKLPKLGGSSVFVYGIDSEFTGEDKGFDLTVFVNNVNMNLDPNKPDEAEVSLDIRQAVLVQAGEL